MTIDEALAHIGAYIEGGDELGVIGEDEAGEAYGVICAEAADLRRQLAEVATRVNAADRAVAVARRERDAAKSTAADLRRQLAACQAELYGMRAQLGDVRVLRMQLESDNVALRRQLAQALGELDACRLALAASEQARVRAENTVEGMRIRLALDQPLPPPTCGHRGMAGSAGCVLPAGHAGAHEYRTER